MKNHEEWYLLSAYLDNEVDSEEKERVESHLTQCAQCKNELDSLQNTKGIVSSVARLSFPLDIQGKILKPIETVSVLGAVRQWWIRPRVWVPIGGFATAVILVGIWFGLDLGRQKETISLAPLLAAHSRYTAESLVPRGNGAVSNYSLQLEKIDETYN